MNLGDNGKPIDRTQIDAARQLLIAQRPDKAIELLKDFTQKVVDDPDALNLLGAAYSMMGNAPAAEKNLPG